MRLIALSCYLVLHGANTFWIIWHCQNLPKVVSVRSVSTPIGPNETHILDRLRLEVERQGLIMVASLNDWLSIPPISQICRVSPTTVTVMYVQHQVMPFYFKAVPTVLWETMKQSCMNCDQFFNEVHYQKGPTNSSQISS